jgi:hypothetical protein
MWLLTVLSGGVAAAQSWRNDWKPGGAHDVDGFLVYSLADAPLTAKEPVPRQDAISIHNLILLK